MSKNERIYEYSELGISKPDAGVSSVKFVPVDEYKDKPASASDIGAIDDTRVLHISTVSYPKDESNLEVVEDKSWRVGMDTMFKCGTCHHTFWGYACSNYECVKGVEAIAVAKRWENDRR